MSENNNIYLGNCLDIMCNITDKSIDLIVTDLPYAQTKESWDCLIPYDSLWDCYNRVIKDNGAIILFGQEPFSSNLRLSNKEMYRYDIYWEKERATNIFQIKKRPGKVIETISVFYKSQPTYNPQMVKYDGTKRANKIKNGKLGKLVDSGNKKPKEYKDTGLRYPLQTVKFKRDILTSNLHPTQKPVDLLKYLILTYSNKGDTILDSCMGSGSTGIACIHTDRNFIGIEMEPKYFNIAKERLENEKC